MTKNSSSSDMDEVPGSLMGWFRHVTIISGSIVAILGAYIPDKPIVKIIAFSLAIVITTIVWITGKKKKVEPPPPPPPGARNGTVLRDLIPFEDGDILIGRTHAIGDILVRIKSLDLNKFIVLRGDSGCGKTSLLRAGLMEPLRRSDRTPIYIRKPHELYTLHLQTDSKTVLIIDQFEEIFIDQKQFEFSNFKNKLNEFVQTGVVVLISIRDDYFAKLQNLIPVIQDPTSSRSSYELTNLTVDQAQEVLTYSTESDVTKFEPPLITEIISDLQKNGYIRPPELQIVGSILKRRGIKNVDQYESLERASGIISRYIKGVINGTTNPDIARKILRIVSAEDFLSKSPQDISLQVMIKGVDAENSEVPIEETVKQCIATLRENRIILETDPGYYNLVHDYLAPLIQIATLGSETKYEWANRVLKRSIAMFKTDPAYRIRTSLLLKLRKYADKSILHTKDCRVLFNRSLRRQALRTVLPMLVAGFLTTSFIVFLSYSYYFTIRPDKTDDIDYIPILVCSGHPNWKFMPGYGNVEVETDFDADQIRRDSVQFLLKLIEGTISGLKPFSSDTLDDWISTLLPQLTSATQIETMALIGRKLDITADSLSEITGLLLLSSRFDFDERYGHNIFWQFKLDLRQDKIAFVSQLKAIFHSVDSVDIRLRVGAGFLLATMAINEPELKSFVTVDDLNRSIDVLEKLRIARRNGEMRFSGHTPQLLQALIHANPGNVNGELLSRLYSLLDKDSDVDYVLDVLYHCSLVCPDQIDRATAIALEKVALRHRSYYVKLRIYEALFRIGSTKTKVIDSQTLRQLWFESKQVTGVKDKMKLRLLFSHMASKQHILEPAALREINADLASNDEYKRCLAAILSLRIELNRGEPINKHSLSIVFDALKEKGLKGVKDESLKAELIREGVILLGDIAVVQNSFTYDHPELIDRICKLIPDGITSRYDGIDLAILKLARSNPNLISQGVIDELVSLATKDENDVATQALFRLSYLVPEMLGKSAERAKIKSYESIVYLDNALLKANYFMLKKRVPIGNIVDTLRSLIRNPQSKIKRRCGEVGLLIYCFENPNNIKRVRNILHEMIQSNEPQLRISGNLTLRSLSMIEEMIGYQNDSRKLNVTISHQLLFENELNRILLSLASPDYKF